LYLINHVNTLLRSRFDLEANHTLYRPAEMKLAIKKSKAESLSKKNEAIKMYRLLGVLKW
jgi:hypothetical protein